MDSLTELALHAKSALYGRAGPVTFGSRPKSNQKRLPLLPALSSSARVVRDASTAHESYADAAQNVCRRRIYDLTTLRASGRAEGALVSKHCVRDDLTQNSNSAYS